MEEQSITEYESYSSQIVEKLNGKINRRVKFPSDESLVTHFIEPLNPWKDVKTFTNEEILASYEQCCQKSDIKPIPSIVIQLKALPSHHEGRLSCLLLKDIKLSVKHVEALEEILKRVRFVTIDLENALKNDEACASLLDSIEYYESATHLVLRRNTDAGLWTWKAVCHLIRRSSFLESLDCSNTNLMQFALIPFTRSLKQNHSLTTLDLSDCHMSGRPFHFLINALKMNLHLKNLCLRSNHLAARDMVKLGELLKVNSYLQYLNLSFNPIQDGGLRGLILSLLQQLNHHKALDSSTKSEHLAYFSADEGCLEKCLTPAPTQECSTAFTSRERQCYCRAPSNLNELTTSHPNEPIKSPPPSPADSKEFYLNMENYDFTLGEAKVSPPVIQCEAPSCDDSTLPLESPTTTHEESSANKSDLSLLLSQSSINGSDYYTLETGPPCASNIFHRGLGLRHLSLIQTNLTTKGLPELVPYLVHPSCTLRNLCLGMNPLGDQGILDLKPSLLNNRSLHKLDLRQCKLGDEAAIALAEVIGNEPQCCALKNIDLRQNASIKFAGVLALARALEFNKTIQYLALDEETTLHTGKSLFYKTIEISNSISDAACPQSAPPIVSNGFGDGHLKSGNAVDPTAVAKRRFFLPLKSYRWTSDNWLLTLLSPTSSTPAQSSYNYPNCLDYPNEGICGKESPPQAEFGSQIPNDNSFVSSLPSIISNGRVIVNQDVPEDHTEQMKESKNLKHSVLDDDTITDIPTYLIKYKAYIESLCQRNRQAQMRHCYT